MVSLHTSPLAQPGTGDAGGMNVYIDAVARGLAELGTEVEVFTRATSPSQAPTVEAAPGYLVHHLKAGPYQGLGKDDLPGHLCAFTAELMRFEARRPAGSFDALHTHYWLSGQVGWVAANRWDVPWVHSMHTLARVKNAHRAVGEPPEPGARILGEDQVVGAADLLIANTRAEADDLIRWYDADPSGVDVVSPGVDLRTFVPGDQAAARRAVHLPQDKVVLLFVGRLQPLKAPDVLLRAVAVMVAADPSLPGRLEVVVCGGPSGSAALHPAQLQELAATLGIADIVRFEPPADRARLAQLLRAADVTVVPSYNESFGLVAVESQAVGTPVAAAAVGGLRTAVADGVGGVLVDGHDPQHWAAALARLVEDPALRRRLSRGAVKHAQRFSWTATAQGLLGSYRAAAATSRTARAAG
jgi:D-inositol-3-phosphate glycosyltransferase